MGRHRDVNKLSVILDLIAAGHTRKEMADIIGVTYLSMCKYLRRQGLSVANKVAEYHPTFWTPEKIAELDRLRAIGMSFGEISLKIGAGVDSCRQVWGRSGFYAKYDKDVNHDKM